MADQEQSKAPTEPSKYASSSSQAVQQAGNPASGIGIGVGNASAASIFAGLEEDDEKDRRSKQYERRYAEFAMAYNERGAQRKNIVTRNKIWEESTARTEKRLAEIEEEREELLEKLKTMEAAKAGLNRENIFAKTGEEDEETLRRYKAYFNLESDELDV